MNGNNMKTDTLNFRFINRITELENKNNIRSATILKLEERIKYLETKNSAAENTIRCLENEVFKQTVLISPEDEAGEDEVFCQRYWCNECKCDSIDVCSKYCPGCGRKIKWSKELEEINSASIQE